MPTVSDVLFRDPENYRYFLAKYAEYLHPVLDTFCLLPDAESLSSPDSCKAGNNPSTICQARELPRPPFNGSQPLEGWRVEGLREYTPDVLISRQFSHFFNGYTQAFNRKYDRKGSLLMPRFKRKEVTNETYFTRLIYYIHANPVHHGFVGSLADWPYSSYESVLLAKATRLRKDEVLEWFGGPTEYKRFHEQPSDRTLPLEMDLLITLRVIYSFFPLPLQGFENP